MTEQVKLEPCPWCECDRICIEEETVTVHKMFHAYCDRCYASGPSMNGTREEAIAAWNRRASRAGEWNADIANAPRDGRWLLAASNDHTQHFRIRWGQRDTGYYWLTEGGRYYGDGLFGGWIEYPRTLRKEP